MLLATQAIVPIAWPEVPVELFQVTEATPRLSAASPWNEMALAIVSMMLDPGLVIRSQGGVVSPGELGGCGAGGAGVGGFVGVGGAGAGVGTGLLGGAGLVGGAGVGGGWRITDINCDTVSLAASVAVIVIWFPPMLRGTAGMFQRAEPDAAPVNPVLVRHVTRTGPVPPDALPEMETVVAIVVVVSGEFCMVR